MRKRLKSLLGGLVLSLGLTACGGDAPVKQSDIPVSESQIQESALESSEEVKEDVKEEQSSEAISLEEAEWIPEEFEMDDVVNIDYIAPTMSNVYFYGIIQKMI